MKTFDLKPQLFDTLKSYNKKNFMSDLMAGIIVGIVALPLAIAFGIASGVTPEKGIITAIVAGFLVSLSAAVRYRLEVRRELLLLSSTASSRNTASKDSPSLPLWQAYSSYCSDC